jgi:nucleoside-diphosphate-sugar epimerase
MNNDILKRDSERIISNIDLKSLSGLTILITGATGLIGTQLLSTLFHLRKYKLNFNLYFQHHRELSTQVRYLTKLFTPIKIDLSDINCYEQLPNADVIIHAAGYAQPSIFMAEPEKTMSVNSTATCALIKKLNGGGKFLFISSSELYSGLNRPLLNEEDIGKTTPLHPRATYIEGKRSGETYVNLFRQQGVDAKSARASLVYGPGVRRNDGRVMSNLIDKALLGGKIELLDQGKAVRTYCYITDLVEMLLHVLLHGNESVYNVGGISKITILELAQKIGARLNVPVILPTHDHGIQGPPDMVNMNLTKVLSEFSKNNFVDFDKGLDRTIEWHKSLYSK